MQWSYKIARIAGTEVRIHITFVLFLAWSALNSYFVGGAAAAVQSVIFMLALFGCVALHEFGHAAAARGYGIHTPDITLYPIGGVARLDRMPRNPMHEIVVALAGPAVNVAIAAVLLIIGQPAQYDNLDYLSDPRFDLVSRLVSVNIALVLFNLIPAFPMDGGRVFRALLALRLNYVRATKIAATVGQVVAVIFGILGFFGNPMLIFIAFVICQGAQQESASEQGRGFSKPGRPVWRSHII